MNIDETRFVELLEANNAKLLHQVRGETKLVVEANNEIIETNTKQLLEINNEKLQADLRSEMKDVVIEAFEEVMMPVLNDILKNQEEYDHQRTRLDDRQDQQSHQLNSHEKRIVLLEKPVTA